MPSLRELARPSIGHQDLMFATPGKLFSAHGWIFAAQVRRLCCLVTKCGGVVSLQAKNGRDMSSLFPELVDEVGPIRDDFVADCELVCTGRSGMPAVGSSSAQERAATHASNSASGGRRSGMHLRVRSPFFWLNGADFRPRPLLERKQALKCTLPGNRRIRYTGQLDSSADLWRLAVQMDLEGIVGKEVTSIYTAGPSTRWLKIEADDVTERKRQRRPG